MPFVSVRDIKMYYEIQGVGPGLLFISGTGGDLRQSPNVFDSPLVSHFEILAYDQRGLGQTERPDAPYTMEDYAADADALLEVIGWDSCQVIGVSFGGMVAQEFALNYPHRVERLVLACTSSGGAGGASYPIHELPDLPLRELAEKFIELADTRHGSSWKASNPEKHQNLVDQVMTGLEAIRKDLDRGSGLRKQMEARKDHDTYTRLPNLEMLVYICGGRYDGIAPIANLKAMEDQIPNASLEFFEGGHGFLSEDPKAFERIIAILKSGH